MTSTMGSITTSTAALMWFMMNTSVTSRILMAIIWTVLAIVCVVTDRFDKRSSRASRD